MDAQQIIEQYQNAVIQIATATGTGTGFYIKEFDLIITNDHVVSENAEVTVAGKAFEKTMARVWYTDRKHDLAFLEAPKQVELPEVRLGQYEKMKDGDHVVAIGHPYGLNYTATQGVISKVDRIRDGLKFIQIDAAINPGNSGGPLVNYDGEVIGVNSFIIRGGDNLGFALPVSYLREALQLYSPNRGQASTRCYSCGYLVTSGNIDSTKYCPSCGTEVKLPEIPEKEIEPVGAAKTIEEILKDLGINFIAVGNVASLNDGNTNNYSFRHSVNSFEKAFYRLRVNELNNTHSYSAVITIGGDKTTGVKMYPTIIRNSLLNIVSGFPVERIRITGMNGQDVYIKDMNGAEGFFMITLPGLQKGFYVVNVSGKEGKSTGKILIE